MTTALITGASAGLGEVFARRLAEQGHDLVLVARDKERLDRLRAGLVDRHGREVEVLPADLTTQEGLAIVERRLRDPDQPVDLLVNNAGFALSNGFLRNDVADEERMLDLLVRAVMRLTHAGLSAMAGRGRGAILNVASVAAFVPHGTYGASKAWVVSFSEGLARSAARRGVKLTVVCPGFTHTEFHQRAGIPKEGVPGWMWLEADRVVDEGLADLQAGKALSIPSKRYKAVYALTRVAPRRLLAAAAAR